MIILHFIFIENTVNVKIVKGILLALKNLLQGFAILRIMLAMESLKQIGEFGSFIIRISKLIKLGRLGC